jgi:hypothetical protein
LVAAVELEVAAVLARFLLVVAPVATVSLAPAAAAALAALSASVRVVAAPGAMGTP